MPEVWVPTLPYETLGRQVQTTIQVYVRVEEKPFGIAMVDVASFCGAEYRARHDL